MQSEKVSKIMTSGKNRTSCWILFSNNTSFLNPTNFTNTFWKKVYHIWCSHLSMITQNNKVSQESYGLSNYVKDPQNKRNEKWTFNITIFHGWFNDLSVLRSPFKLIIFNHYHRRHSESIAHEASMIETAVPTNCFVYFYIVLVRCGTPFWYIYKGGYYTNTRALFTIIENDFHINNESTIQLKDQACIVNLFYVCSNNK